MKKSLLIGCGNRRTKDIWLDGEEDWAGELITLDMNPMCNPTLVCDMSVACESMPFADAEFDEVHAYDSLEHWGFQGDWQNWFTEMEEYHRILKPGGTFGFIVPIGRDAFADPGHCRFFSENHFLMLNQDWYARMIEEGKPVTDYRWFWEKNFDIVFMEIHGDHHLAGLLRKA